MCEFYVCSGVYGVEVVRQLLDVSSLCFHFLQYIIHVVWCLALWVGCVFLRLLSRFRTISMVAWTGVFVILRLTKSHLFVIDRATLTTNNFRLNSVNCTNQYKLACKNKTKKVQPDSSSALTKKITTSHTHCMLHPRYLPYLYFSICLYIGCLLSKAIT